MVRLLALAALVVPFAVKAAAKPPPPPPRPAPKLEVTLTATTPTSGLLAESSAILSQIQLSEAERAKIQGRVDTQFGRQATQ